MLNLSQTLTRKSEPKGSIALDLVCFSRRKQVTVASPLPQTIYGPFTTNCHLLSSIKRLHIPPKERMRERMYLK